MQELLGENRQSLFPPTEGFGGNQQCELRIPGALKAALGEKGPFLVGVDLCGAAERWLQAALTQPQRVNPAGRGTISSVQMRALPRVGNHLSAAQRLLSHLHPSLAPLQGPCRKLVADRPTSCTTCRSRCGDLCQQNQFPK